MFSVDRFQTGGGREVSPDLSTSSPEGWPVGLKAFGTEASHRITIGFSFFKQNDVKFHVPVGIIKLH